MKRLFEREGTSPVPPMQPATRRRLITIFEPDVADLEKLLGRPMTLWRNAWSRELGDLASQEAVELRAPQQAG